MSRHGWIAHVLARILDLLLYRVTRFAVSVPGRLPGSAGRRSSSGASLVVGAGTGDAVSATAMRDEHDLAATFPGAERFEEPVVAALDTDAVTTESEAEGAGDERANDDRDAVEGGGWSIDETLTFTPDAALDLVDEIEFSFEPEPNLGESGTGSGTGAGDDFASLIAADDTGVGWVEGGGSRDCPEMFPIKGNGNSHIYHLPGQASYGATIPELCFATEDAAAAEGYRPVKRSHAAH